MGLILSGRKVQAKEIIQIQETVKMFPALSRQELALTIAEHLSWKTPAGRLKIASCSKALEKMEELKLIKLPLKQVQTKYTSKKIVWTEKTKEQQEIVLATSDLPSLELQITHGKENGDLWNEYVDRYHYLGYKRPFGAHLKYFIVSHSSEGDQLLGCILFASSAWSLASRDKWIEWSKSDKEKRLNLIINNSRFLIFPWVKMRNLASKVLSMIEDQIQGDWQKAYNYKPVLLETFVDSSKYEGSCYKAANWQHLGNTTGRGRTGNPNDEKKSIKYIFVKPLDKNFRAILKNKKIPASGRPPIIKDEKFATIWHQVVHIVSEVAIEFDQAWQQRSRVINSMLLVLLIFRLLFSKNKQSYNTTIAELWDNCKRLNIPLPQEDPIAASSFADAREKLDENIFKKLNDRVISLYQDETDDVYNWLGHRLFAIDGSKINLPRELLESGYKLPSNNAHYPQGLLSCLYQLKSKIPYTFELANDANERQSALTHLKALKRNDVVVYDRGYFSYAMLYYHALLGIHPIFRLAKNTYKEIEAFRSGNQTDSIVTIHPLGKAKEKIERTHPGLICIPLQLRLIKYKINEVTYCLGTTLLDKKYPSSIFPDVYHSRWSIEELYKISKDFIEVEDFHSKNERGVKQELFAHFTLITMNRIFSNEASQQGSDDISKLLGEKDHLNEKSPKNINFKNCLATFARRMEEIFLFPASCVNSVVSEMLRGIKRCYQTIRPNRKYPRRSRKPVGKWRAEGMASGMVTVGQSINTCTP